MTKKEKARAYYLANREKIIAQTTEYKKKNKEWFREYCKSRARLPRSKELQRRNALRRLGWTQKGYEVKFTEQDGKCAICLEPSTKSLDADHEHSDPPKPRGLLCNKHNQMLGLSGDSIKVLEAAIVYLKKYKTQNE